MQTFTIDTVDSEVLDELLDEIQQLYLASEQTLIELEKSPKDNELQRSLFRSIHTIKGDLGLVNFAPIVPLVSAVEDILDGLRHGKLQYSPLMGDLALQTMDEVEHFVTEAITEGSVSYDNQRYQEFIGIVANIKPSAEQNNDAILKRALLCLDPSLAIDNQTEKSPEAILTNRWQPQIGLFKELVESVEKRSSYFLGRGERIAKLCSYINELAGHPIDPTQLVVACYLHDLGMGFIHQDIMSKSGKLTAEERAIIQSHVYRSGALLEGLQEWHEAHQIILQHHERIDGTGYPKGLMGDTICDGAKLLAIVDSFDAITHERAHVAHIKRPIRRAIGELNQQADLLFDGVWLGYFTTAMSNIIRQKRQD